MHAEAFAFVQQTVEGLALKRPHVLELGSYDVNGSVRGLFAHAASYTGLDARSGPGVDVTARAQDYMPARLAHVVVSTEAAEHDPDPAGLVAAAYRCLRPGGVLIFTAAAPERAPHGNDGGAQRSDEHYANIPPADLRRWLKAAGFVDAHVSHAPAVGDVYAVAHKPAQET